MPYHATLPALLASLALSAGEPQVAAAPPEPGPPARDRLADFFGRTKGITRLIPASEVWESLASGASRYVVVDVRPAEEYAKGHVPGALNLPIDVLFRAESLAKLPARDRPIVLVCQSGHTESMALGGLAALGYEPWVMRFGMIGWNAETKVKAGSPLQDGDTVRGVGGPIER
jgi:rhodanese-related sulfurtransferase